jgi:hypothetical protein
MSMNHFSIPYLIHVCIEEAILGFWKEWFLEGVAPIKVWFVGRVYRMLQKFGIRWMEYGDPIDSMECPSNMTIGLCQHQVGTDNKWTCDLIQLLFSI